MALSDTIRELIIAEMAALFNDYTFESMTSPTIYRGRQVFDPDTEPPPLITLLPRVEASERTEYQEDKHDMPVDVICLTRLGTANPSELGEQVLGELIHCIFGTRSGAGGTWTKTGGMTDDYADEVVYRSGGIDQYPDQLGQEILHVGLTVAITYRTVTGDPYNAP